MILLKKKLLVQFCVYTNYYVILYADTCRHGYQLYDDSNYCFFKSNSQEFRLPHIIIIKKSIQNC